MASWRALGEGFKTTFSISPTARQYQSIFKDGKTRPGKFSPYVVFVLAVLAEAGITKRDGTPIAPETIIIYRKKASKTSA